ncbi:hypothetical protein [Almyronema epifaneia]|uniref:Uncharacterized protein n=1 Tax=Almyronema epifaneia S1 TaxID=2991925 RepID=A0ABW6IFF1_9CYAN
MADKDQIKRHIAMTSGIKFEITPPMKGDEARKARIMEHIKKSKG